MRVLVVDDEVRVVRAWARVLSMQGFDVLSATSVAGARQVVSAKAKIDCAIIDWACRMAAARP